MIGQKVYATGKLPNRIILLGEGPGQNEAAQGRVFCGISGADLDWVFLKRAARLRREDVYVTYVVKWRTDEEDSDPTPEDIARDEPELLMEIELCGPEIIVAIGKVAAQWLMQTMDIDMEKVTGVPMVCPRYPDKTLLVTYHPAAALRLPERYYHTTYWCFEQLGRLVRGEIGCHPPPMEVHYGEGAGPDSLPGELTLAVDTEGSVSDPWGLSASGAEGRAVVLRRHAARTEALRSRRIVGHNIIHDVNVLDALDAPIDLDKSEDTMLAAYLLPYLPRRLKALSFKLLGVQQDEYEDIIAPAEEAICKDYLQKVLTSNACVHCGGSGQTTRPYKRNPNKFKQEKCSECAGDCTAWPKPESRLVLDGNSAGRTYTPRSIGRSVRALLERGIRFREGWQNTDEAVRAVVEGQLGGIREATLDGVDRERAIHYSAADADLTLRVWHKLEPVLKQNGLWNVYQIDKGIIPIINRMQKNGILINRDHFSKLHTQFVGEKDRIKENLNALAAIYGWSEPLNPGSPTQIAKLIYTAMGIKPIRGNTSTDEKALETLKIKYKHNSTLSQAVDLITDYRELDKMDGTYAVPLPAAADKFDRIHTRFLMHVVASGRLSSRDPNLQNIPTRTERGRSIRAGFIAKPGCKLVSIDLDQIELRVAAHLSQDANLIDVFVGAETCPVYLQTGKCHCHDIHTRTAALIYKKQTWEITTQERLLAKTMNFLILYGGGAGKLQSELALLGIVVTRDECVQYINDWFDAYPGIRDYIEACHTQAQSLGYVTDLFGRRRYVQGVWSCMDRVREESLKWAVNSPDQGTAAGILKLWMRRIWDNVLPPYWEKGIYCEPLLTVHDEVILEAEESICDEVIAKCVEQAALSFEMLVPIRAKGAAAYNWSELK